MLLLEDAVRRLHACRPLLRGVKARVGGQITLSDEDLRALHGFEDVVTAPQARALDGWLASAYRGSGLSATDAEMLREVLRLYYLKDRRLARAPGLRGRRP